MTGEKGDHPEGKTKFITTLYYNLSDYGQAYLKSSVLQFSGNIQTLFISLWLMKLFCGVVCLLKWCNRENRRWLDHFLNKKGTKAVFVTSTFRLTAGNEVGKHFTLKGKQQQH